MKIPFTIASRLVVQLRKKSDRIKRGIRKVIAAFEVARRGAIYAGRFEFFGIHPKTLDVPIQAVLYIITVSTGDFSPPQNQAGALNENGFV